MTTSGGGDGCNDDHENDEGGDTSPGSSSPCLPRQVISVDHGGHGRRHLLILDHLLLLLNRLGGDGRAAHGLTISRLSVDLWRQGAAWLVHDGLRGTIIEL